MTGDIEGRGVAKWTVRLHVAAILLTFSGGITIMFAMAEVLVVLADFQIAMAGVFGLSGGFILILYRQMLAQYAVTIKGKGRVEFGVLSVRLKEKSIVSKV